MEDHEQVKTYSACMTKAPTKFALFNQDCLPGMRRIATASIDLCMTSPPYNIGIPYGVYKDRRDPKEYLLWCEEWGREVHRLLKPTGSFFLNIGASPSDPLLPHQLVITFSKFFRLQNTLHWIKSITVETKTGEQISVGHFKPHNSPRYVNNLHEYIFHFTKNGDVPLDRLAVGVPYADKTNIARWSHTGGTDLRCRGNNWFIPYETIQNRDRERPHPATFPKQLAVQCIKLHGVRDDLVVMDPFLGLANAGLAARECRAAKFIGFEIDPAYFRVAQERLGLVTAAQEIVETHSPEAAKVGRKGEAN